MRHTTSLYCAAFMWLAGIHYSDASQDGSSPLLASLGARLALNHRPAGLASDSATAFKASGRRESLEPFIEASSQDESQRKTFSDALNDVFRLYEDGAKKAGIQDDLAGALCFYLRSAYAAYRGGDALSGLGLAAGAAQIQAALDTRAMRDASDLEKQRLYETYIMVGGLLAMRIQLAEGDPEARAEIRALGEQALRSLLKLDPGRIKLSVEGFEILPAGGDKKVSKSGLKTLVCSPSKFWVRQEFDDGVRFTCTKEEYLSSNSTAMVLLTKPVTPSGSLQTSFRTYWKSQVLSVMKGEDDPFVMVGSLNGKYRYAFADETMENRKTGEQIRVVYMLVDGGEQLYPAMILESLHFSDRKRFIDPLMASLRPPGTASARPLATTSELAKNWSTTASSVTSYVNAHTGNHAGTSIVAYRHSIHMKPDGTYTANFTGMSNGATTREKERGKYRLKGDMLIFTDATGRTTKKRFLGIDRPPGSAGPIMILLNTAYDLTAGNIALYGEKYGILR